MIKQMNKKTEDLSNTIDQSDLKGQIHRTLHPTRSEQAVFSNGLGTSSRINHMVNYKTNLTTFKKTEKPSIFSKQDGMEPEKNSKKKTGKFTNMWDLNRILLNSQQVQKKKKNHMGNQKTSL